MPHRGDVVAQKGLCNHNFRAALRNLSFICNAQLHDPCEKLISSIFPECAQHAWRRWLNYHCCNETCKLFDNKTAMQGIKRNRASLSINME